MPQLHLYVSDKVATSVKARAAARGMTVSAYLAELVQGETRGGWPAQFFEKVVGGWKGEPLERPPQDQFEQREEF